ncbi:MAG: PEGA domain-containing protein [Bradymonadales bacterium]|nr:PEGA domain-containing protein [Bradymonadales bacterium]
MNRFRLILVVELLLATATAFPVQAQSEGTGDLNELNEQAANHVRRQRYDRALEIYRQIVQADPYWADIWYNLGEVSRVSQQYGDCVLYFSRYLYLIPDAEDSAAVASHVESCSRHIPHGARLEVTVQPQGAKISLDGIELAQGHLPPFSLPPGSHELTVVADNHHPDQRILDLQPGQELSVDILLDQMVRHGTLRIETNVEGAAVTIEGEVVGTTPLDEPIRLRTGLHLVTFTKEGYHDWTRRVEIEADREVLLQVEMRPL